MKETKTTVTTTDTLQTLEADLQATGVQRNYKDTIFRMIFREKENLLSLYNALNGTSYGNAENLEINTLENAVYMNYKNDISFVFNFELLLYEHQSTYSPNIPLRDLLYVARILQNQIKNKNLYSKSLIRIPTPRFVVFYNGTDFQPEQQTLYLSDAFEKKQGESALELAVTVYNINLGHNRKLLDSCQLLREYAQYVAQVRAYTEKMPLAEAVEQAVDDCIRNGILADFLANNRGEAITVSIFEYDEEEHLKCERKEWHEIGSDNLAELLKCMMDAGKNEEVNHILHDSVYRKKLLEEYLQSGNLPANLIP